MSPLRQRGFTLVEVMITVAIIGLLIAISIPGFLRAREETRTRRIQKDLVTIDDATRSYVIEYNLGPTDPMPTLADLIDMGYLRTEPQPPVAGTYIAATAFSELGVIDPDAYPTFVPSGGNVVPGRVHPDLLP